MVEKSNGVPDKTLSTHDKGMAGLKRKETNKNVISGELYSSARANDAMALAQKKEKEAVVARMRETRRKLKEIKLKKTAPNAEVAQELADLNELSEKKRVNSERRAPEDESRLDRVLEAYAKAKNAREFTNFMLENSDVALTKERAEKEPATMQYLESNFKEQKSGLRYEDLLDALPTEQEYIDKASGWESEQTVKIDKTKIIPSGMMEKEKEDLTNVRGVISGEINNEVKLGNREVNKNVTSRTPKTKAVEIEPKYAKELEIRTKVVKEFTSPLVELLKGMPVMEGTGHLLKERATGAIKLINDTKKYFADKYKMSDEDAHKLLMGEEIKGLFKGGQRLKQRQYKINFNGELYQMWLKEEGKINRKK